MPGQRTDDPVGSMQAWGVPDGGRVWIGGHNREARRAVEGLLVNVVRPPDGPIDRAFITPQSVGEGVHFAVKLSKRIVPDGMIWVVVPRRWDAPGTGFQGTPDELQMAMFERGLVERRGATIDETYRCIGFAVDSALF